MQDVEKIKKKHLAYDMHSWAFENHLVSLAGKN